MNKTSKIAVFIVLALLITSCNTKTRFDINEFKKIPAKKLSTYNGNINLSIENKIIIPPKEIIDYLNTMDSTEQYTIYILSNEEKEMFLSYFYYLPIKFQKVINEKVIAIYFIKNFLGGGMSDFAYDDKGEMLNILYFNPDILHFSLTDWISFRDNSSFNKNDNIQINVNCGSQYTGLLHVLFHETSHIYDYHYHFTPFMSEILKDNNTNLQTVFTKGIWDKVYTPIENFNYLSKTHFSGWGLTNKIDKNLAPGLYKKLSKTPFSSLYGSTAWVEDFAETFTWWYLYKYFNIEYKVTINENDEEKVEYIPTKNNLVIKRYEQFNDFTK